MSVVIDGSAGVTTASGAVYNGLQTATVQASTSGTSIDFTSIPSWVKRVTVMFNGISNTSSTDFMVQIGSGSITSSGYIGGESRGASASTNSNGFRICMNNSTTQLYSGIVVLATLGSNIWTQTGNITSNGSDACTVSSGAVTLSGTLDRVRITSTSGTDAFDAGSINIIYE